VAKAIELTVTDGNPKPLVSPATPVTGEVIGLATGENELNHTFTDAFPQGKH
jgi:hypothetical protein